MRKIPGNRLFENSETPSHERLNADVKAASAPCRRDPLEDRAHHFARGDVFMAWLLASALIFGLYLFGDLFPETPNQSVGNENSAPYLISNTKDGSNN